ncbi:MAG: phosphoenolpyruvate synthase [Pseudomonadales bacterium]|jgi:pyruvate,water dikinase
MSANDGYIRWFEEISHGDLLDVGGKNASLGEMYRELTARGVRVPNGFALTTRAYHELIDAPGIRDELTSILAATDVTDVTSLADGGRRCRKLLYEAPFPDAAADALEEAHEALQQEYGADVRMAVRSSATAEDLPEASFAGQHDTFLNVAGAQALLESCRHCLASLFTDRAIRYRHDLGFDHLKVALSVGVMKMARADLASSGVIFTIDTESGHPDVVLLTAAYGLGENVVQGTVDPDEFYVHKPTYRQGHEYVLRRKLGSKMLRMVCGRKRLGSETVNEPTPERLQRTFALTDAEVLELAGYALSIEEHYSGLAGRPTPMDVEWAKDGLDGKLYIVQARPETVASRQDPNQLVRYKVEERGEPLVTGRAVGTAVAAGTARVITSAADLTRFQAGDVLISETTSPDWGTVIKKAAAVVTDRGGRTCHAAIVAREVGIPAVVGSDDATRRVKDGELVTVTCAGGETGKVFAGELNFEKEVTALDTLKRPRTKIMMNVGNPDVAFKTAMIPNDGVGLARLEFIITEYIGIHPMALAHPERLSDPAVRARVLETTAAFAEPAEFFVSRLAEGVATIAAAFYPRPVVIRLSDFKVNEYKALTGGDDFELVEENPMLGFRGASRYGHPAYRDGFALECRALKRVRDEFGLTNVKIMVPFCRRIPEAESVIASMAEEGLERGGNGLEIYVMCEIPNNVILIDEFAKHFDGFSIGSNDLTQLTLGVDRDSQIVAFDFDERDPGVMKMLELAVTGARRNGRYSGICGQAPSDYPEVAEFLVRLGIDSLSLNPDSVLETTRRVLKLEERLEPGG